MEGEKWMNIRNDHLKGLSYKAIADKYSLDWRTVKKYAESDIKPTYERVNIPPTKLDSFRPQIDEWLECQFRKKTAFFKRFFPTLSLRR